MSEVPYLQFGLAVCGLRLATRTAFRLFNQQYQNRVEFRLCPPKAVHDRFIIIDRIRAAWSRSGSNMDLGALKVVIPQIDIHGIAL